MIIRLYANGSVIQTLYLYLLYRPTYFAVTESSFLIVNFIVVFQFNLEKGINADSLSYTLLFNEDGRHGMSGL